MSTRGRPEARFRQSALLEHDKLDTFLGLPAENLGKPNLPCEGGGMGRAEMMNLERAWALPAKAGR